MNKKSYPKTSQLAKSFHKNFIPTSFGVRRLADAPQPAGASSTSKKTTLLCHGPTSLNSTTYGHARFASLREVCGGST